MEVKEIKSNGLHKEYEIVIPAEGILKKVDEQLKEKQGEVNIPGFRPGNAPLDMLRKKFGPEILTKIIEQEVDVTLKQVFEEKNIRPALQPIVEVKSFDDKKDLKFSVKVEVLPPVPSVDWTKIELETFSIKITDEDLQRAHNDILQNFKNFVDAPAGYAAKKGDAVIIDFVGTINGKEFDGGKGDGIRLEIGSNQFIPGFEDQLVGAKEKSKVTVRVVFPKNYNNEKVAGKPAVFEVTVTKVLKPENVEQLNDDFAKKLGVESMEKLDEMIRQKIEADFNGIARLRMKKLLFDQIDSVHKFDVPEGMLKIDFDVMWNEIKAQKQSNPAMFKGKNEDEMKKEYQEIAKRRVRLGIILADTARENGIDVSDADLQQAVYAEAMMRPGQEKMVLDFYKSAENLERLKGPILEEKAVDYILTKIKRNEVEISSKDFFEKYANDFNMESGAA